MGARTDATKVTVSVVDSDTDTSADLDTSVDSVLTLKLELLRLTLFALYAPS
jgi:hypothetical protein